jgi:hypothetical protein
MTLCDRPVTRATLTKYKGRQLVVTMHPTFLSVRLKGKLQRTSGFVLDYAAVYECAAKIAAREALREKRKKR